MKYYKTTQIVLQALCALAFVTAIITAKFRFYVLDLGYYGYFGLGALQVIDSFVNRAEKDRISWLANRNWHFIYLGIIIALFIPSLVSDKLLLLPFLALFYTSPVVAIIVFVSIVRERIRATEEEDTDDAFEESNLFV